MTHRYTFALIIVALISTSFSSGQMSASLDVRGQTDKSAVTVQPNSAEKNLIKKVAAVYPPFAKQTRVQGAVKLQVVISPSGTVESVTVASGHPMLTQAAVDAVKQWQYKPFIVDGRPVAIHTEIELTFTLGISDEDYQAERKSNEAYFTSEDECRKLIKAGRYADAESSCTSSVELAENLPKERQMERVTANDLAGQALLYESKYDLALGFLQNEVTIGERALKLTDAELGYAYHHLGIAYQAVGDIQNAQLYYERAESTLEKARQHVDSDFLKNEYARALQFVLLDYIELLQKTGQMDAAAQAQKRADAVAEEIHAVKRP